MSRWISLTAIAISLCALAVNAYVWHDMHKARTIQFHYRIIPAPQPPPSGLAPPRHLPPVKV